MFSPIFNFVSSSGFRIVYRSRLHLVPCWLKLITELQQRAQLRKSKMARQVIFPINKIHNAWHGAVRLTSQQQWKQGWVKIWKCKFKTYWLSAGRCYWIKKGQWNVPFPEKTIKCAFFSWKVPAVGLLWIPSRESALPFLTRATKKPLFIRSVRKRPRMSTGGWLALILTQTATRIIVYHSFKVGMKRRKAKHKQTNKL